MESIKPGYKTTEFYVTLLVLGLAAAFGAPPTTPWQARLGLFFGAAATAMVYKVARTAQKGAHLDVVAALAEADDAAGAANANGGGIEAQGPQAPKVGFSARGFVRPWVLAVLVAIAVLFSGCAWLKTQEGTAVAIAGDVAHCATDGAIAAVGPLAQTLADAALHGGEADWAGEIAKLEAQAGAFRDCVILAALNRIGAAPVAPVAPTGTALVRFKPLRAVDEAAELEQAKLRLRAALKR